MRKRFEKETHDGWYVFIAASMLAIFAVDLNTVLGVATWLFYLIPLGAFALSADPPVHFSRPAIDVLFEAARDVYGANLIGILLSGASDDGAAGLHEIHQAGGITIVQAPSSADSAIMPAAALALFEPTYVWAPDEIVAGLNRLLHGSGA